MKPPQDAAEADRMARAFSPSCRKTWAWLRGAGIDNPLSFGVLDEISRVEIRRAERDLWAEIEQRWS